MEHQELQLQNFRVAMESHIKALEAQFNQIDKDENPIVYRHYLVAIKESNTLLYDLTGSKFQEFKKLLCTTV